MIKVIFHTLRNCLSGSEFFPLREVPILKRDAIEENHCLSQYSPFGVVTFLALHCHDILNSFPVVLFVCLI